MSRGFRFDVTDSIDVGPAPAAAPPPGVRLPPGWTWGPHGYALPPKTPVNAETRLDAPALDAPDPVVARDRSRQAGREAWKQPLTIDTSAIDRNW